MALLVCRELYRIIPDFMRPRLLVLFVLALASPVRAQELSLLAGGQEGDLNAHAWEIDYRQELCPHVQASVSWLNEGHVSFQGHRDGLALQLWGESPRFHGVSFSAGAGLYGSFDTETSAEESFVQEHDVVPIVSLSAAYRSSSPWTIRFLLSQIAPLQDSRTTLYLLGAGYRFGPDDRDRSVVGMADTSSVTRTVNELTLLAGMSSTNSDKSQSAPALALEYRRRLARFWEGAVSYLNEGDTQVSRRQGVVVQGILMRELVRGRLTVGLGAGAYGALDRPDGFESRSDVNVILTVTGAMRYGSHGLIRMGLTRVLTNHDRDSDVIQIGFGYRWGQDER